MKHYCFFGEGILECFSMKTSHSLPRLGMMRLWQDRNTIIPALLSTCPVLDKIAITYHRGGNDDGCVDLVRDFIREGRNGDCRVEIHYYPYDVYFVHHPWYSEHWFRGHPSSFSCFTQFAFLQSIAGYEKIPHSWVKLDTDTVYVTEVLEYIFKKAEEAAGERKAFKGMLLYHDTVPYQGKLWWTMNNPICGLYRDNCVYNPYIQLHGYGIGYGDDGDFPESVLPESEGSEFLHPPRVCGFQFRKKIWINGPVKVPVDSSLVSPLRKDVIEDFEMYMRPVLMAGGSDYGLLEMSAE